MHSDETSENGQAISAVKKFYLTYKAEIYIKPYSHFRGNFLKNYLVFLACIALLIGGCSDLPHPDMQQLYPEHAIKHGGEMGSWIFGDLKGDGTDQIICTDINQVGLYGIYIEGMEGKIISQINLRYKVRTMKVLSDASTQTRWLFLSFNDQKKVMLSAFKYTWGAPLKREDKSFEAIARTDRNMNNNAVEYFAVIYPEIIDDIDRDGRQELVCRMLDSFSANPRGLVVYDLATGLVKWRYDTPCNLNTVLLDDFDQDGRKEFIISTMAMKNTKEVKNDLSDFNGYTFVLSDKGQKLYQQQDFSDYGQGMLDAEDTDQDGKKEIYHTIVTWGPDPGQNRISVLQWDGSKLKLIRSRDLSPSLERNQNIDFVLRKDKDATYRVILNDRDKKLLVMDDKLNEIDHKYSSNLEFIYEIKDMNRDGSKEFLVETKDSYIEVLNSNFKRLARLKNPFAETDTYNVMLLQRGAKTAPLIAVGTPREMRFYQLKKQPLGVLVWNLFLHYAWLISILLLVIVVSLLNLLHRHMQFLTNAVNIPGVGFIYVKKLHQIRKINQTAWSLANMAEDKDCTSLELCFPHLYRLLKIFAEGKPVRTSIISHLADSDNTRYQITMIKMPTLIRRDLICLVPLVSDGDQENDKNQWADTARRLSHHVRRHITNILLALEVMKEPGTDTESNYRDIIRDEIEKVRIFTHSFQRFTELKNYDLQLQDIIPSVEHCLANCRIPENIKLLKNWTLNSIQAQIEPIRFEEALLNVINNAIDAMPGGGTLQILVKEMPPSASHFNNLKVLVEIEDSGAGIPQKYLEDIWKPFFTTKQSGTGIGIPESKKIIESMGGTMDIHSEEEVGTTVSFWLKGAACE